MKKALIWFRDSVLRIDDNLSLDYAANKDLSCSFIYIYDDKKVIGGASKWFLHQTLLSLQKSIKSRFNENLHIVKGDTVTSLESIILQNQVDYLLYNKVYEPQEVITSNIIEKKIPNSCTAVSFNGSCFFEPNEIYNQKGEFFKVFTPYYKHILTLIHKIPKPLIAPSHLSTFDLRANTIKLDDLMLIPSNPNWSEGWESLYPLTETDTHDSINQFIEDKIKVYKEERNVPSLVSTSRLSPHLHFGIISPKQIYYKLLLHLDDPSAQHFLSEVCWRDFASYILHHFPALPYKNFHSKFDGFPWQEDQTLLKLWQKGQTGIPIVDAGMRELYQTGWMHNRTRMITASFLTKNLLIHWRTGADWFYDCLVDADLASNSFSWQWVAGSGCDGAPYFRIFNPITQGEKFDPQASYIKKWVPELRDRTPKEIHNPMGIPGYYTQAVDLLTSRNLALEIFKGLSPKD